MKRQHLIAIVTLTGLGALCWTAMANSLTQSDSTTPSAAADKEESLRAAAILLMDREQSRISKRLNITAPMEVQLVNGKDTVIEAFENGFIIDATLEEVEAAIVAATLTPALEDDQEASQLLHRGSYRFFAPGSDRAPINAPSID